MRVLLTHNFYGSSAPSGENQVVEAESHLLRQRGHEVGEFFRHSDLIRAEGSWGKIKGAFSTPWNPFSARKMQHKVEEFRPDIVHVHNTFPLLSPSIFYAIGSRAARVLTLHNYRLFCPAAIPMRDGNVCTECLDGRSAIPSLRHGCYRGSRLATVPLAANVGLHRLLGTWAKQVDAFIALTEFQRERMIEAGLPGEFIHVKPNFFPGRPPVVHWSERRNSVVFVGRLTAEKGVRTLVRAWLKWGSSAPELRIVGDGHLRRELEKLAHEATGTPIQFLGQMSKTKAQEEIAMARLLILPSECFETFALVLSEAFALGTPAAVSNIGPLPSLVGKGKNGVVFSPKDPQSLLATVRSAWASKDELERLGVGARRSFEELYTEEINYEKFLWIYERALEVSKLRKADS